jgi:uncharacterized protein YlxW (UPF0749 family)
MNPFEFVLIIVAMAFGMTIIVKRMEFAQREQRLRRSQSENAPAVDAENRRLREEVSELKERLHVLERIATDKEHSLSREIESLRDR